MSSDNNYPIDNDTYAPEQYGMRNHAARDGYQPNSHYGDPPSYNDYENYQPRPRRRSSWGEPGEHNTNPTRTIQRRTGAGTRGRGRNDHYDLYDSDSSSSIDAEYSTRRGRTYSHSDSRDTKKKSRSLSAFGKRVSSYFGPDEHHDGAGNSEGKKWGATAAGAIVGAFAGNVAASLAGREHMNRRGQKNDNKSTSWVPAALGAVVGSFSARELEKNYYRRREVAAAKGSGRKSGWHE